MKHFMDYYTGLTKKVLPIISYIWIVSVLLLVALE